MKNKSTLIVCGSNGIGLSITLQLQNDDYYIFNDIDTLIITARFERVAKFNSLNEK